MTLFCNLFIKRPSYMHELGYSCTCKALIGMSVCVCKKRLKTTLLTVSYWMCQSQYFVLCCLRRSTEKMVFIGRGSSAFVPTSADNV